MRALPILSAVILAISGCADFSINHPSLTRLAISTSDAAQRAAKLANDECARIYQERPFLPEQYPVAIHHERYRWGGDNTNALSGTFPLVTFDLDGSNPQVTLYHHSVQY